MAGGSTDVPLEGSPRLRLAGLLEGGGDASEAHPSPRMRLAMLSQVKGYLENLKDSIDSIKDEM